MKVTAVSSQSVTTLADAAASGLMRNTAGNSHARIDVIAVLPDTRHCVIHRPSKWRSLRWWPHCAPVACFGRYDKLARLMTASCPSVNDTPRRAPRRFVLLGNRSWAPAPGPGGGGRPGAAL